MELPTVQWMTKADRCRTPTPSEEMSAESQMRNEALSALLSWEGATTSVFGGSIRKQLLSEYTIQHNDGLHEHLDRGTYHNYQLSADHFPSLHTDLDVYITNPVDADTCLQDLCVHMKHVMSEYVVVLRNTSENYACTRLWIDTHRHPLAPRVRIQLDLVIAGAGSLFPDFSSNQLCVSTSRVSYGEMSMFSPPGMPHWWTCGDVAERCLLPYPSAACSWSNRTLTRSILGGAHDRRCYTINAIKDQIHNKYTHVLVFSFFRWAQERQRMHQQADVRVYSSYVSAIVRIRLVKLLGEGYTVGGFLHRFNGDGKHIECREGEHKTDLRSVVIRSTGQPAYRLPPPQADEVSLPGRYSEEDTSDDEDGDSDIGSEDATQPIPLYWCHGCRVWHELLEVLL